MDRPEPAVPSFDAGAGSDYLMDVIGEDDDEYVTSGGGGGSKAEVITKTFQAEEDNYMREFMRQKDSVLEDLEWVVGKTQEITRITAQLEEVYAEDETKELQKALQDCIKSGDYRSIRCKKKLNALKHATKELKKQQNKRVKSQMQIRRNIQSTLEKRFIEVTRDLQEAKATYQARLRQNIMRQVQIANPQASEEDIAEAIDKGTAHDLITRALNRTQLSHQAFQDKADDVAEKSKDIKELEQSMQRLRQMFEDLAQLIEMQSEQIDAIEVTVDEAGSNVEAGNKELEGVVTEKQAIRKRITILLVIFGVCIVGATILIVIWQTIGF